MGHRGIGELATGRFLPSLETPAQASREERTIDVKEQGKGR